ncbi:MAG: PLP-dependent aminotransferase family protein [Gemmatimonadales bacterium]|nr:PLP-dependent aminotransferase family protein [Gemmatimonadales bacterium]
MRPPPAKAPAGLFLPLEHTTAAPLYRQLYTGVREAILAGRLAPGSGLPSSRALAEELGVSRNTVILAFDQLVAEGYVEGAPRSGTRVAAVLARPTVVQRSPRPGPGPSARGRAIAATPMAALSRGATPAIPFRPGVPALDRFPIALWSRLTARRWRRHPALEYGDPGGYAPLREAIADYVRVARGARCLSGQVIVTGGSQQGVDLAARVLLDPGDAVWMEDPGYTGARTALLAAGARLVPVPVDSDGLAVDRAERLAPDARMAYVSPSHQFPLGVTMSAGRRLALLRWAARADAWVLEDDYDSEFRYDARPLASLQGMDEEGRVIYVGTFSKTLFPALRLGYLIVPPRLVDAFRAARAVSDRHSPTMDQAVLADFLAGGHFARHVRRMRRLYSERQEVLVDAAHRRLGARLHVVPSAAGMHLVGWLEHGRDDAEVSARAAEFGVEAAPLSRYALVPPERGGLLLGWAGYPPEAIREGVERLGAALE